MGFSLPKLEFGVWVSWKITSTGDRGVGTLTVNLYFIWELQRWFHVHWKIASSPCSFICEMWAQSDKGVFGFSWSLGVKLGFWALQTRSSHPVSMVHRMDSLMFCSPQPEVTFEWMKNAQDKWRDSALSVLRACTAAASAKALPWRSSLWISSFVSLRSWWDFTFL